jgi:L-ascorbate metabolism protein UlaG (beta-lactamase superfamily)
MSTDDNRKRNGEQDIRMKVIYLGHSGFLVETKQAYYLFDYIRGKLPGWKEGKPLYVFVSHSHEDHFSRRVLGEEIADCAKAYIFSSDVRKKLARTEKEWLEIYGQKVYQAEPGKEILLQDCCVQPLKSTDIGAAYIVREKNFTMYHAGDLNWWHWDGESKSRNRNMEVNYKREIERMKGEKIHLAFVPLDPRLSEAYWYGMDYFLRTIDVDVVFPMHFWEDYSVADRYNAEHGKKHPVMKIEREEQEYDIVIEDMERQSKGLQG